jgi:hypothetical protein
MEEIVRLACILGLSIVFILEFVLYYCTLPLMSLSKLFHYFKFLVKICITFGPYDYLSTGWAII